MLSWTPVLLCLAAVVPHGWAYKAAVIEFEPKIGEVGKVLSHTEAMQIVDSNIDSLETYTQQAHSKGAQIMVWPEDGLFGFLNCKRDEIAPYLEEINVNSNPCAEGNQTNHITFRVSCLAKANQMVIVMDMGDKVPCDKQHDPNCPSNGQYQYNTQVAFDSDGLILAKYHKTHLYFESQYNTPKKPDPVTFTTKFGVTFGMMVCYDVMYPQPALTYIKGGVKDIILSSWWVNTPPSFTGTMYYQAYARTFNVNVLVAGGVQSPAWQYSGSGIFTPTEDVASYYNTGIPAHTMMLMGDVPTTTTNTQSLLPVTLPPVRSQQVRPSSCKQHQVRTQADIFRAADLNCPNSNYWTSFKASSAASGSVSAHCGTFTCHFDYQIADSTEAWTYALVAFAGNYNEPEGYYEENCMMYRCHTHDNCLTKVVETRTQFESFKLSASFVRSTALFGLAAGRYADTLQPNGTIVSGKLFQTSQMFHNEYLLSATFFGRDF